ncbi:MAG: hypothetical protein JJ902_07535 [Roseibium sp.]|nr:hypothetical protein [Roseibium sp.]
MPEPIVPSREVLNQIAALPLSQRPLIICDVDEVVLHLIRHMETYLQGQGLRFLTADYRLTGNIARQDEQTPLAADTVRRHIQAFFDAENHRQDLVEGANHALLALSAAWDVVFLTNLPGAHNKPVRERLLASYGLSFPVVTNSGPKGGAVAALSAGRPDPVVFIDDSPANHSSVNASLPSAIQIQFIADDRFRARLSQQDHIDLVTGDWHQTASFIEGMLR